MTDPINPSVCRNARRNTARRQRRQDRQRGILRLTSGCGPAFGIPTGNRRVAEPYRKAAALAQSSVIFRPIRHPTPLPRDVVAAIGIELERHDEDSRDCRWGQDRAILGRHHQIAARRGFGAVQL
jgi:hypothetical protein